MGLQDRDYMKRDEDGHFLDCECSHCKSKRLQKLYPYNTNVPYGGGNDPRFRATSTQDAKNKGLLIWDYKTGQYILPIPKLKTKKQENSKQLFDKEHVGYYKNEYKSIKYKKVIKYIVNIIAGLVILSIITYIIIKLRGI